MVTKYIDMSLSGVSGMGTTGDPYSYLAFKTYAETAGSWTDDHTFKFRSRGYEYAVDRVMLLVDCGGYSATMESEGDEPSVLRCTSSAAYTGSGLLSFINAVNLTIRNLIVEDTGGDDGLQIMVVGCTGDLVIENNSFYVALSAPSPVEEQVLFYLAVAAPASARVVGNTIKYSGELTSEPNSTGIYVSGGGGSPISVLLSSNYFDGKIANWIEVNGESYDDQVSGYIRNNYVYNDSELANLVYIHDGTQSGLTVSGNVDNSSTASQFPSYNGAYAGVHSVLTPLTGSALINGGYAETGWLTDIFGQTRDANPDVGAAEFIGGGGGTPISQFLSQAERGNPIRLTAVTPNADIILSFGNTTVILSERYQTRVIRGGAEIPYVVTTEADRRAIDLGLWFTAKQVLSSRSLRQAILVGAIRVDTGTVRLTLTAVASFSSSSSSYSSCSSSSCSSSSSFSSSSSCSSCSSCSSSSSSGAENLPDRGAYEYVP